jgi:hypothetical protein
LAQGWLLGPGQGQALVQESVRALALAKLVQVQGVAGAEVAARHNLDHRVRSPAVIEPRHPILLAKVGAWGVAFPRHRPARVASAPVVHLLSW